MTTVSYVITVYNKAAFLRRVIDALKKQTGSFDREFVFINDGSTDQSWDIVKRETAGLENVVLVEQNNQGVAIATNNAVKVASGDFIKLVDSDDILAPFCTELLLNTLEQTQTDFVFGIAGFHDTEDGLVFAREENPDVIRFDDPLYSVIDRGFARVSHCLFKKSLFDQANGCDARIFSQDHSLFMRLSHLGKLAQVRTVVCSSPLDEPGRIMNNNAQVIHDSTLALAYHLKDHSDLSQGQRSLAQKKIVSRVWKWARKVHGRSFFSSEFLLYVLIRLGRSLSGDKLVSLCAVFCENAQVRRP